MKKWSSKFEFRVHVSNTVSSGEGGDVTVKTTEYKRRRAVRGACCVSVMRPSVTFCYSDFVRHEVVGSLRVSVGACGHLRCHPKHSELS